MARSVLEGVLKKKQASWSPPPRQLAKDKTYMMLKKIKKNKKSMNFTEKLIAQINK